MDQQTRENNFVVFLKSLIPMLVALGKQLGVGGIAMFLGSFAKTAEVLAEYPDLDAEALTDLVSRRLLADETFMGAITLSTMLVLAIVFGIWFFMHPVSKTMNSTKSALPAKNVLLIIAAGIFTQLGISILLTLILPLMPKLSNSYSETMEGLSSGGPIVTIISVVFLAPFAEELIFRGLTMRSTIRQWRSFLLVNFLQALYFGIYHMQPVQSVYAFLLGLALGYVAFRLNNIFASMLFHAAINGSSFLVVMLPESIFENTLLLVLIGIVCIPIVIGLLYMLQLPTIAPVHTVPVSPVTPAAPVAPGPVYGPEYTQNNIITDENIVSDDNKNESDQ